MSVRAPQENFERLLVSFEGNDAVKWRSNKRVERKVAAAAVPRGHIGGGIRRG
jgi:hypothetical protein